MDVAIVITFMLSQSERKSNGGMSRLPFGSLRAPPVDLTRPGVCVNIILSRSHFPFRISREKELGCCKTSDGAGKKAD